MNKNKIGGYQPLPTPGNALARPPVPPPPPPPRIVKSGDWTDAISFSVFILCIFGMGLMIGIKINGC